MSIQQIPTMCLNCSTVCGMIAKVENGKIVKLEGNPKDPNSRGKLCAKGQAAINMVEDPDRIQYPMKRVGPRGSGQWERITWDHAISMVAERLKPLRKESRPEELVLLYGRDRTNGFLERFTDAFGTPNKLGHRGLCSLNKRMAIKAAIGETDWDTPDLANAAYILNFGSNFYEAHQGHVGMMQRAAEAKRKGAYMVTFDVRLSNTAAKSDEWIPIFPGTDGVVALAIGNVILEENLFDSSFLTHHTNATIEEWCKHYEIYTPEYAEQESGVPAEKIREIARGFAKAAPRATTVSNRGAHAHENGFDNEWAIICLNALVGSINKKGGWRYIPGDVNLSVPQPGPLPPKTKVRTELSHPSSFPFVNEMYPRAISSTIFPYIAEKRAKVDTLLSYYVNAPMSWPQGPKFVRDILLDEELIPFHVVIDAFHSEMAETADLVLPDATFLEKWDLDARNSHDFHPYVGLRQPVVQPPGECRDIRDILISLAKAVDEEMAGYFPFRNAKEFIQLWARQLPGGLENLQKEGIWIDEDPYVPKNNYFQFHLERLGRKPRYSPILKHKEMSEDELILTTFKWNVHTQSRTANQQWLTEIVSDNPCWIHPHTAAKYNIQNGQVIELINGDSKIDVKALVTEAIHPRVIAVSASFGHWQYGRTAKEKGVNPNSLITHWMDPVAGGQSWNDTIVTLKVKD
jgi:thiosulfate reductase / polysulfide reductase chain A